MNKETANSANTTPNPNAKQWENLDAAKDSSKELQDLQDLLPPYELTATEQAIGLDHPFYDPNDTILYDENGQKIVPDQEFTLKAASLAWDVPLENMSDFNNIYLKQQHKVKQYYKALKKNNNIPEELKGSGTSLSFYYKVGDQIEAERSARADERRQRMSETDVYNIAHGTFDPVALEAITDPKQRQDYLDELRDTQEDDQWNALFEELKLRKSDESHDQDKSQDQDLKSKIEAISDMTKKLEQECQKRQADADRLKALLDQIQTEDPEEPKTPEDTENPKNPENLTIAAYNIDMESDLVSEAESRASETLKAELANQKGVKGFLTRLWKGNFMKRYYENQYKHEFLQGDRRVVDAEGREVTLAQYLTSSRGAAHAARFAMSELAGSGYGLHKGEKQAIVNERETNLFKDAFQVYVKSRESGANSFAALHAFRERLKFDRAKARDQGANINQAVYNNYEAVAENIFENAEHYGGLERALECFKVYDAKAIYAVRAERHNSAVDSITDRLEKRGHFATAQIVNAAAGIAVPLCTKGAWAVGGVLASIGLGSLMAGLKAKNEARVNRAAALYNQAVGKDFVNSSASPDQRDHYQNKLAKNEQEIMDTLYKPAKASSLTHNLEAALESGDVNAMLQASAESHARMDFTQTYDKDLISYSSANKAGDEDLAHLIMLHRVDQALKDQGKSDALNTIVKRNLNNFRADVESQDAKFKTVQRKVAAKAAAKYATFGAVTSLVVVPEATAFFDDHSTGLLEQAMTGASNDVSGASNTPLESLRSLFDQNPNLADSYTLSADQTAERDYLLQNGYTETMVHDEITTTGSQLQEVPFDQSGMEVNANVDWANNATPISEGNELGVRGYGDQGYQFVSQEAISTMPDGTAINVQDIISNGQGLALATLPDGTEMLIQPHLDAAGQLILIDSDGMAQLANGGEVYLGNNFEHLSFGYSPDNLQPNPDGSINFTSFATETGTGALSGDDLSVTQLVETTYTVPAEYRYDLIQNPEITVGPAVPYFSSYNTGPSRPRQEPTPTPPRPNPPEEPTSAQQPNSAPSSNNTGDNATDRATDVIDDHSTSGVLSLIHENLDLIGGETGERLIAEPSTIAASAAEYDTAYDNWYNSLSQDGQAAVSRIFYRLRVAGPAVSEQFNHNFYRWASSRIDNHSA